MEILELLTIERNVLISISVLLLLVYTLVSQFFPKIFRLNYDFPRLVTFRVREEIGQSLKPFAQAQLLLAGVFSLTMGFLVLFLGMYLVENPGPNMLFDFESYWSGLFRWLAISVGVFLFIYIKLAFLFFFSTLFNLGSGFQRQFSDFFTCSSIFFLVVLVFLSTLLYSQLVPGEVLANALVRVSVIFLFYQTILIYFRLLQSVQYSKLYIFSYICTTELIPLFIGLKYLIR